MVLETPSVSTVRECLGKYREQQLKDQKPNNPIDSTLIYVHKILNYIVLSAIVLSFIVNICRLVLQELPIDHSIQWVELLILRQVYIALPLLYLGYPLVLMIGLCYGNANVIALFHSLQSPSIQQHQQQVMK